MALSISTAADVAGAAQESLLGYGVVGLLALAGGWFAWTTVQRERRKTDEAEARNHALNESIRTEFVPAMTRATDAIGRVTDVMAQVIDYLPEQQPPPRRRS